MDAGLICGRDLPPDADLNKMIQEEGCVCYSRLAGGCSCDKRGDLFLLDLEWQFLLHPQQGLDSF